MPTFRQGDIVRVPFPYVERPVLQHRPALVISNAVLGYAHSLIWVAMITSAENRSWPHDIPIPDDRTMSGLAVASIVRLCKLAIIEASLAGPIGRLDRTSWEQVAVLLRLYAGVDEKAT